MEAPILDFFDEKGVIDENKYILQDKVEYLKKNNIDTALLIFTRNFLEEIDDKELVEDFFDFSNASNSYKNYIYAKKFVVSVVPVGAPVAAMLMELLGYMGIKNFFACGSSGRLSEGIDSTAFVLVDKAIRCEGTSYRYAKPSLYTETDKDLTKHIETHLKQLKLPYKKGTTWTTDCFLRETKSEIELRKNQGAVCVEMECSAWCCIAKYRKYKFAQLLYFSDSVKKEGWELYDTIHITRKSIITFMLDCVSEFVKK